MLIADVIIIAALFTAFAALHSYLASEKLKSFLFKKYGNRMAFYRFFYNLTALLTFYLYIELSPKPDIIIFEYNIPFDIIIFIVQIIPLCAFFYLCFKTDSKEFLGISQIVRYFRGEYAADQGDDSSGLVTGGLYKISRHPMYMTLILFIWLRAQMDLFDFVSSLAITIYLYIGSVFEEKKLENRFGRTYSDYKNKTPRIFPWDRF